MNAGHLDAVPKRLRLWVKAGGRVLPGLERRRAAEAELFMSDVEPQAGRGATGVPKSVETEDRLRRAGSVAGGVVAAAGVASLLPAWVLLAGLAVSALAVAAWLSWRWRRPSQGVA